MNRAIGEIRERLTLIFNKLETIESKLVRQEEDIKAYMEQSPASLDSNELLVAGLKSTKTSFELLRDEIDELHQVTIELFKGQ
jgi:hypothetical protein